MNNIEKKACILLAVWGEKFIKDFLRYGLLSLLSPGNVPTFAKTYKTTFVVLTKSQDISVFEKNPAFKALKTVCDIQFLAIDDLITIGNHSTTLTYAYERAIRETKHEMLKTYFILLNADYIFAEGSFKGLIKYMAKEPSVICAGNFQVMEYEIKPILRDLIDRTNHIMRIPPRELLEKSFRHLHPVTLSCVLNQENLHNHRANRFFLSYDRHTLAGRFYLLHVLCIKPETMDFQIGSSFDYSFVPEMCPSKNISVITDSDDYLVIEMQPKKHELVNVHFGPLNLDKLVSCLAEWTTDQHRANVSHIIYYHTNELTEDVKNVIQIKSNQLINEFKIKLENYKPKPYRGHPYWIGAVKAFNRSKPLLKNLEEQVAYNEFISLETISTWRKIYYRLVGYPPSVNRLHYRWQEFMMTKANLKQFVANHPPKKTLVLCSSDEKDFMIYARWLKNDFDLNFQLYFQTLKNRKSLMKKIKAHQFERCILFVKATDLKKIKQFLTVLKSILTQEAPILIYVLNENNDSPTSLHDFSKVFLSKVNHFNNLGYMITRIATVHSNFSFIGTLTIKWINLKFNYNKKWRFLMYCLLGIPGMLFNFLRNRFLGITSSKSGHCTNILVTLAPENKKT